MVTDEEASLQTYHHLQHPRHMDEGLLMRMIKGIATRAYEACAEAIPEAFGLSSSTVSRRFIKASAQKLAQFRERSLAQYDLVALFIDGKTFADQEMIIALIKSLVNNLGGIVSKARKNSDGILNICAKNLNGNDLIE